MYAFMGSFNDIVKSIAETLVTEGQERYINRENLTHEITKTISPVYFTTQQHWPFSSYKWFGQSKLFAQNEILSEWFGINPMLNTWYFPDVYLKPQNEKIRNIVDHEVQGSVIKENYTYGERWNARHQFFNVYQKLKNNIYTRQALMVIYGFWDTSPKEWNIPCTILHQFHYHNDKLNIFVYMRSNDFFRGFKYDPLLASFLLQVMANAVNAPLGTINFFIADLHVYKSDLKDISFSDEEKKKNWPLITFDSLKEFEEEMELLRAFEAGLRLRKKMIIDFEDFNFTWSYVWAKRWTKYWLPEVLSKSE